MVKFFDSRRCTSACKRINMKTENRKTENIKTVWSLFRFFFHIGFFTFGGGWSILAQMEQEFVEIEKLITKEELVELTAIGRFLLGIMITNIAMLFGYRICGRYSWRIDLCAGRTHTGLHADPSGGYIWGDSLWNERGCGNSVICRVHLS